MMPPSFLLLPRALARRFRSVRSLPVRSVSAWTLPVLLALLAAVARPTPALAQRSDTALLVVANLNFDCYPDSVFGVRNGALRYLPTHIAWGRFDPLRAERCPQDSQTTRSAEPKRYARTDFAYPDWLSVGGSVALQNLNEDDSLTDVCLYLWGKYRKGNQTRDTMLVLAIFGQTDLQTQKRIELSTIGVFQSEPYYAMQLRAGEEFVKPGIRDLSRVKSYELPRVKVKVRREKGKDTTATDTVSVRDSTVIAPEGRSGDYVVKVYPNPTPEGATSINRHAGRRKPRKRGYAPARLAGLGSGPRAAVYRRPPWCGCTRERGRSGHIRS